MSLKELIEIQRLHMGDNFVPALLILGGVGMALHYEELSQFYDGVPLIMAYGLPVSGKSLAVQIAMSLIGETKSIGGNVFTIFQLVIKLSNYQLMSEVILYCTMF